MSALKGKAENICSRRVFPTLTRTGRSVRISETRKTFRDPLRLPSAATERRELAARRIKQDMMSLEHG
jgi:hypothetical protein